VSPFCRTGGDGSYFKLLPISAKVFVNLLPTVEAAVMIVKAISEAISPYSMAVAPDSLRKKSVKSRMAMSLCLRRGRERGRRVPSPGFAIVNRTCPRDFSAVKGARNRIYGLQSLTAR
jgi:hypothetical protein